MLLLMVFAFIGGVVTILSPCILPVLPIILSTGTVGGKTRAWGVVSGFVMSFTFFTLFLSSLVKLLGIDANVLRNVAALIILLFGLVMVVPALQAWWEQLSAQLTSRGPQTQGAGFGGGLLIGLSLGLLWTPCVGPILASIIALAASASVSSQAVIITLAYALGTSIPMFLLLTGSQKVMTTLPALKQKSSMIQRVFGVLMLLTALLLFLQWDRKFQAWVLERFPQYGAGLTSLEDTTGVQNAIENVLQPTPGKQSVGEKLNSLIPYPSAPDFTGGGTWINSQPLTMAQLKGKVVLVDFWTYTCINCIRTLPYVKAWYQSYKDDGLVVVGVHTPEFAFEHETANVEKAVKDYGVTYPVVQDNDYAIWNAYENHYWPAHYLIDATGKIRYTHFGEGKYRETEDKIKALLQEAGKQTSNTDVNLPEYKVETFTPETYLGYNRQAGLTSPEKVVHDQLSTYSLPHKLSTNDWALSGSWDIKAESASMQPGASLTFAFDAKQVNVVLKPQMSSRVRILLDGKVVGSEAAGQDVKDGVLNVDADRMYELISLPSAQEHEVTLVFSDGGVDVFAFTFG